CQLACLPISKNVALRHSSVSALSTAGVLPGQGPSSKVRTTSLLRRKSYCLKCSKPKPGPPVVSIWIVRATPSALGLVHFAAATGVAAGAGAGTGEAAGGNAGLAVGAAPVVGARCASAGPRVAPMTKSDADSANTHATEPRIPPSADRIS